MHTEGSVVILSLDPDSNEASRDKWNIHSCELVQYCCICSFKKDFLMARSVRQDNYMN